MSEKVSKAINKQEESIYFIFNRDKILIKANTEFLTFPTANEFKIDMIECLNKSYVWEWDCLKYYVFEADDTFSIPQGYIFEKVHTCRNHYDEKNYGRAAMAFQTLNWDKNHKYCGICGAKLSVIGKDKSKECSKCGKKVFPEISPAIIVAIFRDDKILLAHNSNFPDNLYSLIAGFVELGETLEEAAVREIREEVGIEVKNLQYFRSQSWPFPNSLMFGFTAEYVSGEIKVDGEEITDANWFTPNNFPILPGHGSIARTIIEWYIENYKA